MMHSSSTYKSTLQEARNLPTREDVVQWMIQAPDKIALREQIGRIVLAEWDQKEARAFHAEEMAKNRKMHSQTQWLAVIGIVVGLVVGLPESCSPFKSKATQSESPPASIHTTSASPVAPETSQNGALPAAKESGTLSPNQSAEPPKKAEE